MWASKETVEELTAQIEVLSARVAELKGEEDYLTKRRDLEKTEDRLREEINKLKVDKSVLVERNAKDQREVDHMIGLERKRQEFEHEQQMEAVDGARREAMLEVREENLTKDQKRFDEHMEFMEGRFESEVDYLKDMVGQVLDRLPSIEVDATANVKGKSDVG